MTDIEITASDEEIEKATIELNETGKRIKNAIDSIRKGMERAVEINEMIGDALDEILRVTINRALHVMTIPEDLDLKELENMQPIKPPIMSAWNYTMEEWNEMQPGRGSALMAEKVDEAIKAMYEQGYDPETMDIEHMQGDEPFSIKLVAVPKELLDIHGKPVTLYGTKRTEGDFIPIRDHLCHRGVHSASKVCVICGHAMTI